MRPEHLRLAGGGLALDATVTANEPLGAETHVLLDAAGTRLWARTPGFDAPPRGDAVRLHVAEESVLYFDSATGERIGGAG